MRKLFLVIFFALWSGPAGVSQDQPLHITIKSDKTVYAEGDPIVLVVVLDNTGQSTARIYSPEYAGVTEVVVENSKGIRVLPRGISVERKRFDSFIVIPPGNSKSITVQNLRWYFCGGAWEYAGGAQLVPDTYQIYVTVTNPPAWTCHEDPNNPRKPFEKTDLAATLKSNKITLRVERK